MVSGKTCRIVTLASALGAIVYLFSSPWMSKATSTETTTITSAVAAIIECKTSSFNNVLGKQQDDPELIDYIRQHMLQPPSANSYNLKKPKEIHYSQYGQSIHADKTFLHAMRDGFFIEAGAVDGEHLSNTLYFEKTLGWRGLLIEPTPDAFQALLTKNRRAYSINAALATSTVAAEALFKNEGNRGVLSHIDQGGKYMEEDVKVKLVPLYSILAALNVTVVDFLSLDIESFEVKVIKTLPFEKIKFRLMCIEVNHIPEGLDHLTQYLTSKGYKYLGKKGIDAWYGWPDLLYPQLKTS